MLCGFETELPSQIHAHHIKPKSLGGTDNDWNKVLLCRSLSQFNICSRSQTSESIHLKVKIQLKFYVGEIQLAGKLLECKSLKNNEIFYIKAIPANHK